MVRHTKKSQIGNRNSQILLGAHMSIRGGVSMAIERARSIHCTAMQIFVKNNMQWFARTLRRGVIRAFLDHVERGELLSVFVHANYTFNRPPPNPPCHRNDSRTARGSRVDRHEHIGKGRIGPDAFRFIMRDSLFRKIPKVLETPKGKDLREDVINLKTLRLLVETR